MPKFSSHLERKFRATTLYKRSRQYFDIDRINRLQQHQQLNRRKPSTSQEHPRSHTLTQQLNSVFSCTEDKRCERVQMDIEKTFGKFERQNTGRSETVTTEPSQGGRSRTLDMNKMLSREYYEKERKATQNESKFCNFESFEGPKNHTVDFEKCLERGKRDKRQEWSIKCQRCRIHSKKDQIDNPELNSEELGRKKEILVFDQSIFRPLIDLKKRNPEHQPKSIDAPKRHYERIWKAERLTKKGQKQVVGAFYHGGVKWGYSQMQTRLTKANAAYLKFHNAASMNQLQWSSLKRKTDLIEQRRQQILARKQIEDVKGQICDVVYFRRNL